MKCDGVAEAFCPFWPSPNAVCSRLKQTCQIWFLGGSPNLSMIYKWRQRSFLDNNFHNLPLNCCTWFLIWWEFPNCPFFWLHCMPSNHICLVSSTFPGERSCLHFQAWPISKNAPHPSEVSILLGWSSFFGQVLRRYVCLGCMCPRGEATYCRCFAGVVMKCNDC